LREIDPARVILSQRGHYFAHVSHALRADIADGRRNEGLEFRSTNLLWKIGPDDFDFLAFPVAQFLTPGTVVYFGRFLTLLNHFLQEHLDFIVREHSLAMHLRLDVRVRDCRNDQAQRCNAPLVFRLHRLFERAVDIVAQHGYGLLDCYVAPRMYTHACTRSMTAKMTQKDVVSDQGERSSRHPCSPSGAGVGEVCAPSDDASWTEPQATALLVLADGTVLEGFGFGATGYAVGEVCFNTAMTGYQEILTDPSYAGQIITFTFPHIGNVGTNEEDIETLNMAATPGLRGIVLHADITQPSNYRATRPLHEWLRARGVIGLSGLDTRALTTLMRTKGMPNAVIAHEPSGRFDLARLQREAREWPGLVGMDLVPTVTSAQRSVWDQTAWTWGEGFGHLQQPKFHVVAIDYGIKRNILRQLASNRCKVTVVPAQTTASEIMVLQPDGVFLSNGPGDPAATGEYAVPAIRELLAAAVPVFGICLGHQMLAIAVGAKTVKMRQGHHGANHPVKDLLTGKVEITSMNHGFAVDGATIPDSATETHVSLFDASNCGIALKQKPAFSVQYHPEASPGPRDSHYLFARFTELMRKSRSG
jgi:carbamoyl-phosphate synthase small subunit